MLKKLFILTALAISAVPVYAADGTRPLLIGEELIQEIPNFLVIFHVSDADTGLPLSGVLVGADSRPYGESTLTPLNIHDVATDLTGADGSATVEVASVLNSDDWLLLDGFAEKEGYAPNPWWMRNILVKDAYAKGRYEVNVKLKRIVPAKPTTLAVPLD